MMSADTSTRPRQITVAIVDDDATVRASLQRLCAAFDLHATIFASGPEFLAALEADASPIDCLLLDAHMPHMTGAELHWHLNERGVRIPTIVFTADDAPEMPAHYAPVGIIAFLRKPISGEDLLAAVEKAVRQPKLGV